MRNHVTEEAPRYGVLEANTADTEIARAAEEVRTLGYTVIHAGFSASEIKILSKKFDSLHADYLGKYGTERLKSLDEHNTLRLPLAWDPLFLELAGNHKLLGIVRDLIGGKFILNQQNGIINPPGERYNQGAWHRDLPYQHFISSRPIAVNALFCVDEFTKRNGATQVLPASHKQERFPSDAYALKNALQVEAPAGSFILLDCMLYHRGGPNQSQFRRRAVNHVYTIPFIKQQIDIRSALADREIDDAFKELLGYPYGTPGSVDAFLGARNQYG